MTAPNTDPHDLTRFITAQEAMIDRVRAELRAGAGCQPRAIACGVAVINRKHSAGIELVAALQEALLPAGAIASGTSRSAKCDAPCSSVQTRGIIMSGILLALWRPVNFPHLS